MTVLSVIAFSEKRPSQKGSKYDTPKGETKIALIGFYKSQHHRIIHIERDLRRTSSSTSCLKQGQL